MESIILNLILTFLTGVLLWYIKRLFSKRDAQDKIKEEATIKNNTLLLKGVSASLGLGEETANFVVTKTGRHELDEARQDAREARKAIEDFTKIQTSKQLSQ